MIHVCIPVLKRYDLLSDLLMSLHASTVKPHTVHVIDNGRQPERVAVAMASTPEGCLTDIFIPDAPMGLAEAWNWFICHVPEERLICNDDITFSPHSLETLIAKRGEFVSALPGSNACSCFLLRDSCVEKVGLFDESISPGYAYFEDCDYVERIIMAGIVPAITPCECGVNHVGSQTIMSNNQDEWNEHHRRFLLAQSNFVAKWGRLPNVPGPHWPKAVEA